MTGTAVHHEPAPFGMGGTVGESLAAQRAAMEGLDTLGRVPVLALPMQSLATPQSLNPPSLFGLALSWEEQGPRDLQERTRLAMAEANTVHEWNREAAIKLTGLAVTRGEDPLRMSRALLSMPAHMSSRDTAQKTVDEMSWSARGKPKWQRHGWRHAPPSLRRVIRSLWHVLAGCSWATLAAPSSASDAIVPS